MSEAWDEATYESVATRRSHFFKPLAVLLLKLGLTPDFMTGLGVAAMVGFVVAIGHSHVWAFWLMILMLLCDQLDGAMARAAKTASDRGKFTDVLADSTSFSLAVIGFIKVGLVGGPIGALYIYLVVLARFLMAVKKNADRRRSDWLFYAGAGPWPNTFVYFTYLLFAFNVLFGWQLLESSTILFAILLVWKSIYDFLDIKRLPAKKT